MNEKLNPRRYPYRIEAADPERASSIYIPSTHTNFKGAKAGLFKVRQQYPHDRWRLVKVEIIEVSDLGRAGRPVRKEEPHDHQHDSETT